MDLPGIIGQMCLRPAMWVGMPPYLARIEAFIDGFDMACYGGPLQGWREWLIVRVNLGDNLM